MKSWKNIVFALSIFGWCGCAHLATVKETRARLPTATASDQQLRVAKAYLSAAEREQPLTALANDLSAAKLSLQVLDQRPGDSSAQSIYSFSVARAVQNIDLANLQPWRQSSNVSFNHGSFLLTTPRPIDQEHDPSRYDLFPTDSLKISGQFFKTRPSISGIGAPLVAVGRVENSRSREQFKLRRVYAPVTAVIKFADKRAELEFVDPMKTERVVIGKRTFPLAIDLNAPTAMLIARERPERLGFARVINPQKYADTTRLTQLQQFDPARTPVIFVHGLQETGASWTPMIDTLRNDPWIRGHYQFWFFSYPSGYPYPYSAALFRQDLDGIDRAFPNHKRVVLIGHSMGGMVCRLMVTDAGDKIWRDFFATPPAKTPLARATRKLLEESLVFNHRPDVQRAVFISTPHRGSKLASGWIGRIGAALVRTPRLFTSVYTSTKPLLVSDPAARTLKRSGIPYHSIMGDRGRGDTPNSSDGIVPYWSSHLDGAKSELIVNSGHGAQCDPQAIREVARILKLQRQ